ncbi:MAG: extracellular solute-binding protein [Anaerolineae bacterium]|nr:extracellular solute-binding protein [Anaerolineae bacterium]
MQRYHALLAILVVVGMLFGGASLFAQGSPVTSTFGLPVEPAVEGPLAGVDPAGQRITYWHQHTGDRLTVFDAQVARFNAENPWDITVDATNQGDYTATYTKMLAGIVSGELPNLVVAFQGQAATYQLEGALVDLSVFVTDPQWGYGLEELADFFPGFLEQDLSPQFDQRLGFPLSRSMEMLYVNVDGLAALGYTAPPASWAEFQEMACAWSASGEGRVGFTLHTDDSFLAAAVFALGGDIFDYEQDAYTYDSPEAIYVLELLQEMLVEGCANRVTERNSDRYDFARQVNLFYFGSSAAVPFVEAAIAEAGLGAFEWTIAAVPYRDFGQETPTQKLNGASVSIPRTTPEAELAAWLFVRWLAEPVQQAEWAIASDYFPVRASAAEALGDYLQADARYAAAFELLGATRMVPPLAGYDAVRALVESEGVIPIFDGAPARETLQRVMDEVNDLYQTQFQP